MSDDNNAFGYDSEQWDLALKEKMFLGRVTREAKRLLAEEESPTPDAPPITPMDVRVQRERPPTLFRIEGWQQQGTKGVLVAQAKSGTTTLTGNLVRSLVDGDKFLSVHKVSKVVDRVTILDFEMPEEVAEDWLIKQNISNMDKVNLCCMRGSASSFNILDPKVREAWALLLGECLTDYLILDCLRPALDGLNLDEHRDAGRFFGAFDALLKEAGIGEALVVHHMGHGGERSRGDSRIIDWPDVEWRMCREDINDKRSPRFITAYGRNVEIPEQRLELDESNNHLRLVKGGRTDQGALDALTAVVSVVSAESEPLSQKKILSILKDTDTEFSRRDIIKALEIAEFRGQVETMKGLHNATLYRTPESWIRSRFAGGEG